jgi:uncharacterized protein YndB with AHSA1/START domain
MLDDPRPSAPADARDLVLTRLLQAPRAAVWRCWTEPELLKQWFAPKPWTTPDVALDLRPGGGSRFVMRSPEGQDFPNDGVYLEVVPERRLVFTDAYTQGWKPSEKPFFTGVIELGDEAGGTRYTATARHWTAEARDEHARMGFHEGWGQCADQLEALARTL